MIKNVLIVLVFFSLMACGDEVRDGGACVYQTRIIPAEVVSIMPLDSPWYDLQLVLRKDSYTINAPDTISYIYETKDYLTAARIEELGISIGNRH